MKRLLLVLSAMLVALPLVAQDVVVRIDGRRDEGRVVGVDDQLVRLQQAVPAGTVMTAIPRAEIDRVEFAITEAEKKLLEAATVAHLENLRQLWELRRPLLQLEASNAGEIGLVYGDLLLQTEKEPAIERAFAVFQEIEKGDWDVRRRVRAQQSRLRAMIAQGRAEEAVKEAAEMAREAEEPLALIEAKHVLAEASFGQFKELLEEHPRWQEDELIRPVRNRLYHDTLDLYLFPYLFHGAEEAAAARGLWGALQVYRLAGEEEHAHECAQDLVVLYPGSTEATHAREILDATPAEEPPTET